MKRSIFRRILFTTFTFFWISPNFAWAGNINPENSTTPTSPPPNNSDIASNSGNNSEISTNSSTLGTPQQTGIVQFNNSNPNTLTYPNCGGICTFGIGRLNLGNNGHPNIEAVMGAVMQFDSPENKYAQAQRDLSKAQSDRISQEGQVSILSKLADAIENCQDSRAYLLALTAAKTLRMKPEQLLEGAYKAGRTCSSSPRNAVTSVSPT